MSLYSLKQKNIKNLGKLINLLVNLITNVMKHFLVLLITLGVDDFVTDQIFVSSFNFFQLDQMLEQSNFVEIFLFFNDVIQRINLFLECS